MLTSDNFTSYYSKEIKKFAHKLSKHDINLGLFHRNLNTLKINYIASYDPGIIAAQYSCDKNQIDMTAKSILYQTIYHELFHCSSTVNTEEYIFSGFMQSDKEEAVLGLGINEGFTEYLADKYFNSVNGYLLQRFYAYKLTEIIGFQKLEDYYFNANLGLLINDLSKYDNINNINDFIVYLDAYTVAEQTNFEYIDDYKILQSILTKCSDLLITWYNKKLKGVNEKLFSYIQEFYECYININGNYLNTYPSDKCLDSLSLQKVRKVENR